MPMPSLRSYLRKELLIYNWKSSSSVYKRRAFLIFFKSIYELGIGIENSFFGLAHVRYKAYIPHTDIAHVCYIALI